jgi:hypothetical protein
VPGNLLDRAFVSSHNGVRVIVTNAQRAELIAGFMNGNLEAFR